MTNLDSARTAFDRWADAYERGGNPERHLGAATLLEALHACGVEALPTRSLWRDEKGREVELICFAEADASEFDVLAVYRYNDWILHAPRTDFLRKFKPLAGER